MQKWLTIFCLFMLTTCTSYDEIICGQKIIWNDYSGNKDVCEALKKCTKITHLEMKDDTLIEFISTQNELNSVCMYTDNVAGCYWQAIDFTSDNKIYIYYDLDIIKNDIFCHEKTHESLSSATHDGFEWKLLKKGYNNEN